MNPRRLEVLLPADVSAHDYAAVAHAIWAVLDAAGLDEDGVLRTDEDREVVADAESDARSEDG
jgi:hypothetical protein